MSEEGGKCAQPVSKRLYRIDFASNPAASLSQVWGGAKGFHFPFNIVIVTISVTLQFCRRLFFSGDAADRERVRQQVVTVGRILLGMQLLPPVEDQKGLK